MTRRLILASASPARRRLLTDAGYDPEIIVSGIDEIGGTPGTLAIAKAEAVAAAVVGDALVLGCDSMLDIDGALYGKPASPTVARARWRQMRGRAGILRTGHALIDTHTGRLVHAIESTTVHFGDVTDAEIDAYVASGEPLAVAGGFTIDGRGSVFIDSIAGDHANVIGLSMPLFRRLLDDLGVPVMELWS